MNYISDSDPYEVFTKAIETLAKAVQPTLGPMACDIAVQHVNKQLGYIIINDGYKTMEFLSHKDPEVASAMETIKQFIKTTAQVAGDGTTSTTLVMQSLIHRCKNLSLDRVRQEKESMLSILPKLKMEASEEEIIKSVATVAAKKPFLVDKVVEAFIHSKAVSYQYAQQEGVTVDITEGVILDKAITSPEFLMGKPQITFNNCNIMIITEPIKSFQELMPIADYVGKEPTILLFDTISNAALNSIYLNYETLGVVPISIAQYLKMPNNVMEIFLESLTGVQVVDGVKHKLVEFNSQNVGKISANIHQEKLALTLAIKPEARQIYKDNKLEDEFKLEQAVINVGGSSPSERENNYLRVEDAVMAVNNALEHGVVQSAGRAYLALDESNDSTYLKEFTDLTRFITPTAEYESYKTIEQVIINSFALLEQVKSIYYLLSTD